MRRFWAWLRSLFDNHEQRTSRRDDTEREIRQIRRRAVEIQRTLARVEAQVEAVTRDRQD